MNESIKGFLHSTRQAAMVTITLMLLCGLLFPLLLTGLSALLFPRQAAGSLLTVNGQAVAAEHVGQEFTQDYFLWSRPSAYHYNVYTTDAAGNEVYSDGSAFAGLSSGSNNFAATNPDLIARVQADMAAFLAKNPTVQQQDIPTDLMTASGSGLDPHISPASAAVQVARIAAAANLSEEQVRGAIRDNTEGKLLGVFGEETVNVVKVNIAIAELMQANNG